MKTALWVAAVIIVAWWLLATTPTGLGVPTPP